jgi:HAD superfamily hydrolase (TIGR01509 family)
MNPPIIILDFGGVLVDIRYDKFLRTLEISDTVDEKMLLEKLWPDGKLYESGNISTEDFFARLRRALGTNHSDSQLHEAWLAILDRETEGMAEFVTKLSKVVPLYLLSNTNELHFEHAKTKYPMLGTFVDHFVSYKIGAMKPAPEVYRHVIKTLGRIPEKLLFVDDTEKNVFGAKSVGMRSELYRGLEELKETVRNFTGLLV